jgi:glycosyltransferase involved in cell wall biosynthesis
MINCQLHASKVTLPKHKVGYLNPQYDLSIIVPCYNVERFVKECIESIINQKTTYTFELIVVDDGSTDGTYNILSKMQNQFCIQLIKQKHCGLGKARNIALNMACGRYLMFVDSDDRLKQGYIQSMMDATKHFQVDVVGSGYEFIIGERSYKAKYYNKQSFYVDLEKTPETILKIEGFPIFKVFKAELFAQFSFPEGVVYEDSLIRMTLLQRAKSYQHINIAGYQYRKHKGSVSYTAQRNEQGMDAIYVMYQLERLNVLLGYAFSKTALEVRLLQLSKYLYPRIKHLPVDLQSQALHAAKCLLTQAIPESLPKLDPDMKMILYSILSQDYQLWKRISILVN